MDCASRLRRLPKVAVYLDIFFVIKSEHKFLISCRLQYYCYFSWLARRGGGGRISRRTRSFLI